MHLGEPTGKKAKRVVWGVLGFLALLFVITFWREFFWLFGMPPAEDSGVQALPPIGFIFFNCIVGFLVVFLLWVILISYQALLPISNILAHPLQAILEAYRAGWHLIFYILHMHGPAIFVKDGKENATSEDLQRKEWPGVVVVDYNSAVVLEERNPPPGLNRAFINIGMAILQMLNVVDPHESPRVRGAGIVFSRPRERIRGAVDLRRQWRMQKEVKCYTRDGIELYANVWALFTAGEEPDTVYVTYVGAKSADTVRVVNTTRIRDGYLYITGFSDDLDDEDKREIHAFLQGTGGVTVGDYPFADPPMVPGTFNERVFAAVNAQARNGKQETLRWIDLPTRVAADFYREVLSKANYDELYDVRGTNGFPLPQFRRKLTQRMRCNGILSIRSLYTDSGAPLKSGMVYRETELRGSQIRPLRTPKVLRNRGIKVIASGFGDLIPVNPEVYQQRLNAWRADWELEFEKRMAPADLKTLQERGRAYSEAQEDLWLSLSRLFEQNQFADEALALRIMQALDQAASDPKTRALLPSNTLDAMRYINMLLLPPETPALQQPGPPPGSGGTK